uniref:Uncharacterized protein n=1 Tax=Hordeum vulgare subsp. vulgare TaxID=112509 RepID=A0A8I7BC99_HORVV
METDRAPSGGGPRKPLWRGRRPGRKSSEPERDEEYYTRWCARARYGRRWWCACGSHHSHDSFLPLSVPLPPPPLLPAPPLSVSFYTATSTRLGGDWSTQGANASVLHSSNPTRFRHPNPRTPPSLRPSMLR